MSAFKPSDPMSYKVYDNTTVYSSNSTIPNSIINSESDNEFMGKNVLNNNSTFREWSDSQTMLVMLLYRKWQLKDRKEIPLQSFQEQCAKQLFDLIGINKNATQVRDKINNTRSSYHAILKKSKNGPIEWKKKKIASMTRNVYTFMSKYFNSENIISIDEIDHQINQLSFRTKNIMY